MWRKIVLQIAGVYNAIWGSAVVLFPLYFFDLANLEHPKYVMIWQGLGMVIAVYGLGYYIASFNPLKHWPIILVGFLGKIFGPIGFLLHVLQGTLPWSVGVTIITNDVIWWLPFGWMLKEAYEHHKVYKTEVNKV